MIEGMCPNCEFWNQIPSENPICEFGACRSKDATDAAGGMLMPTSAFGCRFWSEREPHLREHLAKHVDYLLSNWIDWKGGPDKDKKAVALLHADEFIAIFEKHK